MRAVAVAAAIGLPAGILLTAGALKVHDPAALGGLFFALQVPRAFVVAWGSLELLLGAVVLLLPSRLALPVLGVTYTGLATAAAAAWVMGQPDCGCFPNVPIPSWLTSLVDLLMGTALVATSRCAARWETRATGIGTLLPRAGWALLAVVLLVQHLHNERESPIVLTPHSETRVLVQFVRELCPPDAAAIRRGRWTIAVVSDNCRTCRLQEPQLRGYLSALEGHGLRTAFVDISSPCAGTPEFRGAWGLKQPRRVFAMPLPLLIELADGAPLGVEAFDGGQPRRNASSRGVPAPCSGSEGLNTTFRRGSPGCRRSVLARHVLIVPPCRPCPLWLSSSLLCEGGFSERSRARAAGPPSNRLRPVVQNHFAKDPYRIVHYVLAQRRALPWGRHPDELHVPSCIPRRPSRAEKRSGRALRFMRT